MKKSQAPSLRLKSSTSNFKNPVKLSTEKDPKSEKKGDSLRSTESVLDLLSTDQGESADLEQSDLEKPVPIKYNVIYGKQTKKKHKTWEGDGTLEVYSKYIHLKDDCGKIIGTLPCSKARKLEEGQRLYVGSKEVELVELLNSNLQKPEKREPESVQSVLKETVRKTGPQLSGKKFLPPNLKFSSGLALPEPSSLHQWYFNKNGLPLTPVFVEESLSKKLRQHQCAGIIFLYECIMGFKDKNWTGAILADDMGLGKTLQCISLIWTLLKQGPYGEPVLKRVLIVTPSSLTMNWYNEFIKWLGRVKLLPFVVSVKNKPCDFKGPVMIISYEMFLKYYEDVEKFDFDLIICDEGHRLKNMNIKTTQILNRLNCSKRIILTGTPIQNDLQEFFALINFVNPNILGTLLNFRHCFEEPILASRQPNATEEVLKRGKECAQELKRITGMFLLRRTRDILENYLPPRNEIVVFCKPTFSQKSIYNTLIDSYFTDKENDLNSSDGCVHLELITALRKICCHPFLLRKGNFDQDFLNLFPNARDAPVIDDSSKIRITMNILGELQKTSSKEKVVIVSNSTQSLDVIEKFLVSFGYSTCRLDGSTPVSVRNNIVDKFNSSYTSSFVFLLSAKAGGVGLNLTGASRLILFDSDWNPATDLQSVSRIWRDGQKYSVFIYRLLCTGTIEEKIYQRQISKQGLYEGVVDLTSAKSIKLSKEELGDIFASCDVEEDCLTHNILGCDCSKQGEIPVPEVEEERNCELLKYTSSLKISELFHWEHHGSPFSLELLSELCLKDSEQDISFIFRNSKISAN